MLKLTWLITDISEVPFMSVIRQFTLTIHDLPHVVECIDNSEQKTSTRPLVWDEYVLISEERISKITCPTGWVQSTRRYLSCFSLSLVLSFPSISGLRKLTWFPRISVLFTHKLTRFLMVLRGLVTTFHIWKTSYGITVNGLNPGVSVVCWVWSSGLV